MKNISRIFEHAEKIRILTGEIPFKEESGELSRRIGVCCEVWREGKLRIYLQNFESDLENYLGISFFAHTASATPSISNSSSSSFSNPERMRL